MVHVSVHLLGRNEVNSKYQLNLLDQYSFQLLIYHTTAELLDIRF